MPVVIHKYNYEKWLNPDTPFEELRRLMRLLPAEETHVTEAAESPPAQKAQRSLYDI